MAESASSLPAKTEEKKGVPAPQARRPFETLRREVERLFEDFDRGFLAPSFRRSMFEVAPFEREPSWAAAPAVDIVDKGTAYEVTAELPGLDEKNIEVNLVGGSLLIKGEKQEEKEEKKKDYYLHERQYGSFERRFGLPEGVDTDKIEANFKKGVLTVTLPKTAEAQKPAKKIDVKTAA